jgi:radical SAM superfamily enzyme YgiQ (UPF0313 family)
MKVLLISANTVNAPYPVYPLGLDYVTAALADAHSVEIIDMNMLRPDGLARRITGFKPDAVGISLRNVDNTDITDPKGFMAEYKALVAVVRRHTDAPVILGGSGFSIFPEKMIAELTADYGIVGEGERLAALLEAMENQAPVDAIPGVLTPHQPLCPPVPVADIPGPGRPSPSRQPHIAFYLKNGGMLNVQTKRGCPFRCIYCTYPHLEGRRFHLMDPDAVAQAAKAIQEAGARYFFITDSAFNADIDHSLAVAEAFRKHDVSIPWGAFLAPMEVPEHYFDTLRSAGMTHAEFGTESLSNRVLTAYGKVFRRDEVLRAHQRANLAGLHVAHYLLLGGPGETAGTLETTLSHVDKLKKTILFIFCGMRIYPHTPLFDLAVKEGVIAPDQDLLEPVYYTSTAIERDEIQRRVEKAANGRSNWVIAAGGDETGKVIESMYEKGYSGPLWEYLIR